MNIARRNILRSSKLKLNSVRNQSKTSTEYCLDLVKKHDYENFLCTLLLKNTTRSVALAIRSFNIEVAKVAEQVTQPNIGLMRLKFWEETIDKCYSKGPPRIPQHPVAIELYRAVSNVQLTKRYLNTLVKCRADNLSRNTFPTLEALEMYADQSVSNIYLLLLEGSGVRNVHADHAASHLGKAQGIIQQLRTIPIAKKINFIPIPQDILVKHHVSHEDILRAKNSEKLCDCTFEVASRAYQHLTKAKKLLKDVPIGGRSVLLPAVAVENYLERLQNVHHDALHKTLQRRTWSWLPKLWYRSYKNIY